jgi:glutamine amidotransferase
MRAKEDAVINIIDYGMGNVGSVCKMLKRAGAKHVTVSSETCDIEAATALILPGVGSYDRGMQQLEKLSLIPLLERKVIQEKTPILGICLGMQLFSQRSEEGERPGLGWLEAETLRFQFNSEDSRLKVPHMGWNYIQPQRQHWLIDDMEDSRFYFVHSYYVQCRHVEDVLVTANYGFDFTAGVCHENILGTQFHPEKSHRFGLALFRNFVRRIEHAQSASHALPAAEKRRAG